MSVPQDGGRAADEVRGLVDHLFRRSAARIVAVLARVLGVARLDLAEEVVQDAMVRALATWPYRGVPQNPEGWLMRVARNRAIDLLRRESAYRGEILPELRLDVPEASPPADASDSLLDAELEVILMCCHPDIPSEARVALTLKIASGFGVREIARAYLVREDAIAQRLVRAKRRIRDRGIQLEPPRPEQIQERLGSVLDVLYLMFNEGYEAAAGDDLIRLELCAEAIRLARLLLRHPASRRPEVHALLALMLFQASRLEARAGTEGQLMLISEQNRSLWDRAAIAAALRHLERAATGSRLTVYHLEAGIAACHAVAPRYEDTDWSRIIDLYDALVEQSPSPVVALNRAVAVGMRDGPLVALQLIDAFAQHASLGHYFLLPATRGDLLLRLGDAPAAAEQYRRALSLPCSTPERLFLHRRLAACTATPIC